nr:U-box domain-containing protein 45-like [Ipomoea batatas]
MNMWLLVQLHGGMCKSLSAIYAKVLGIFPELEAARPRSTTGIQALCALHIALEKTRTILQHCAECSKLYLVGWKTKLALRPIHRGEVHRLTSAKPRQMVINVKVNSVTNLYSNPLCAMQKETDPALRQRKVAIFGTDHVCDLNNGRQAKVNEESNFTQ